MKCDSILHKSVCLSRSSALPVTIQIWGMGFQNGTGGGDRDMDNFFHGTRDELIRTILTSGGEASASVTVVCSRLTIEMTPDDGSA